MKVKIELEKGETREDAHELLLKALTAQANPKHKEDFPDPAMKHASEELQAKYRNILADMMREINEELE